MKQIGKLNRKYYFALNKHDNYKVTTCPKCNKQTFKKKIPLFMFIKDHGFIILGITCIYCAKCKLIITNQSELESYLVSLFEKINPNIIGNEYFVVGTMDLKEWKKRINNDEKRSLEQEVEFISDFKGLLELNYQPAGWYRNV
ncbi:MAG: hypothetical protein HYV32_00710 [Candidatus Kerfeldbacteria bacterium]|nr:hypothetical protein [Candidatus Kerfeldbacteria bacterium]